VTGAYTINIAPFASSTGSMTVQLYDVLSDVSANATPGGPPVTVTTTAPGQNARIAFNGSAGQRISINITNGTFSFAFLSILKPDGTALGSSRIFGPGDTFIDTTTLPSTGGYTLFIDPNGASTGSATVQIYDVPPDAGGPITPSGAPVTVNTTVPGQNGRLTFAGTAGQRVSLMISNVTISSATAQLLDPSGNPVGGSVFFGTSGGFVDTRTLPSTGTYSLTIDPQYMSTGSATFTLYNVPPDVTGTITPGSAFVSSISAPGQNANYTFDGTAGQRISLKTGPSTISMGYVSITGPGGVQVVSRTLFSSFETFVDARALPATGTYTLSIDPYNDATGFAMVTVYNVPADAAASLTVGGPAQSISIATPGQNGRVTFGGQAGHAVTISLTNITVPISFVSILKPDGTPLVTNQLVGAFPKTIAATPTVDGTYTIVIDPQGTATGSMTLAAG
jgi:hypothetical protein